MKEYEKLYKKKKEEARKKINELKGSGSEENIRINDMMESIKNYKEKKLDNKKISKKYEEWK